MKKALAKNEEKEQGNVENAASQNSFHFGNTLNTIAGRYAINLEVVINEFSNSFGKAYPVTDSKHPEVTDLYAFVAESNMPQRLDVLNTLKDNAINNHIKPLAIEIAPIGTIEKFNLCIILRKPKGVTLRNYMAGRAMPLTEVFVMDFIMPKIVAVLSFYEHFNLCHGGINLDNIYIDENNEITVNDCVRESSGFSQEVIFEPLERIQLMPAGKGRGEVATDFFALGAVCVFLIKGSSKIDTILESQIISYRLTNGSYDLFAREVNASLNFRNLMKGLLCDRKHDRWTTNKVVDWLKGKKYNFPNLVLHKKSTRPFFFNDENYTNAGILGYGIWQNWEAAKRMLKDGKIVKWVENGISNPEAADKLHYTVKISNSNTFITIEDDELVARTILILDSESGIKFRELSFQPDSLPSLILYAFNKSNQDIFSLIEKVILSSIIHVYLEVKVSNLKTHDTMVLIEVDKAKTNIRKKELGFGLERILYDLNPLIVCQSPVVLDCYCHSILRLLTRLNNMAKDNELKLVDRHIAAFICHKLNIKKEIKIGGYVKFTEMDTNKYIKTLVVLAFAQREIKAPELKYLSQRFNESLGTVLEVIRSKTLKTELKDEIQKASETGILDDILQVVTHSTVLLRDKKGFELAQKRYAHLDYMIKNASNTTKIYDQGYSYGLRLSMVIAYIIAGIGMFIMVGEHIF